MTEIRDAINFVGFWRPPPLTPQYLTILMTVRGGTTIFCRILPPPPPDATILNYLNDSEGGGAPLSFVGFWRLPMTPPPTIPKYFTILMTEMRDSYFCRILAPPNAPPPSPDAKILNYLNDRERGRHCLLYDFDAPK